jgi:acetyl/propionyl-CoA carboxylase alpha subunit
MRDALNGFVIRGIRSNIPFQAALMQHHPLPGGKLQYRFLRRNTPTAFDASMVPTTIGAADFVAPSSIAATLTGRQGLSAICRARTQGG